MRLVLGFVLAVTCSALAKPTVSKTETEATNANEIILSDINQSKETDNKVSEESDETDKTLRTEHSLEDFREHARERDIDRDVLNTIIRELKRIKLLRKEKIAKERKNTTIDYDSHDAINRRGHILVPKRARFVDRTIRTTADSLIADQHDGRENEQDPGLELQALIAIYTANTVHDTSHTPDTPHSESAESDQSSDSLEAY